MGETLENGIILQWFNFKYIVLQSQEIIHKSFENILCSSRNKKFYKFEIYIFMALAIYMLDYKSFRKYNKNKEGIIGSSGNEMSRQNTIRL